MSRGLTEQIEEDIGKWLSSGLDQEAVGRLSKLGKKLHKEEMSTSQIRKVFGEIKKLEMKGFENFEEQELLLLKPQLAYAARKSDPVGKLRDVLSRGIDEVFKGEGPEERKKRFDNFCKIFEAILAYFRAESG